jgi:hypothetical protein
LKKDIESVSSDRTNWFKNHSMTEEEKRKLIEDKLKRVFNNVELTKRVDKLLKS